MAWTQWPTYVPVAERRARARHEMDKLRKRGQDIQPVEIEGRTIARSFWGRGWCEHLESFSDFQSRLPRGRTYVRNGSVCHLAMMPGRVEAIVSGSDLYDVRIKINKLKPTIWKTVKRRCSGRIGSMLELLQGKLSDQVMSVVTDRKQGLFPRPGEIQFSCDCPDWAEMCKHVAAVLYGVGSRLDSWPEQLFLLRDVEAQELISSEISIPSATTTADVLEESTLGEIFGIELDEHGVQQPVQNPAAESRPAPVSKKRGSLGGRAGHSGKAQHRKKGKTYKKRESKKKTTRSAGRRTSAAAGRTKDAGSGVRRPVNRKRREAAATVGSDQVRTAGRSTARIRPTGKSVARLRGRLKLSVAEFARRLCVTTASVYRWEAAPGQLKLQARTLAALAELQHQVQAN